MSEGNIGKRMPDSHSDSMRLPSLTVTRWFWPSHLTSKSSVCKMKKLRHSWYGSSNFILSKFCLAAVNIWHRKIKWGRRLNATWWGN